MLGPCKGLSTVSTGAGTKARGSMLRTLGGLHMLQTWTGKPFCALLTRPVFGVILGGSCADPGCMRTGLWGPPLADDDDTIEPYLVRSIESLLVVL